MSDLVNHEAIWSNYMPTWAYLEGAAAPQSKFFLLRLSGAYSLSWVFAKPRV